MELLINTLLGLFIGAFGTLIGAGGGFILVPILLFTHPEMKPEEITAISLAVVCLNASSGSVAYGLKKRIDYKSVLIFSLATLPGSIIGAKLTQHINKGLFNILFAILLIGISLFLMFRPEQGAFASRNKEKHAANRSLTDADGISYQYSFNPVTGIILSFFVGILSSLLGIGGGIIHVPALVSLLGFPVHIATATSHLLLAVMSLAGTLVHVGDGSLDHTWPMVLSIGCGVIVGAQIGARLSDRIKARWIIRALAGALILVGIRLLFLK